MTTAKEVVQKADDIKIPVASKKTNKVKTPKVKLVSYEVKAIIPVGMYANIQPGIIVQAETLEQAERAVMPHIEALFAKYREGGAMTVTTAPVKKQDETGPKGPTVPGTNKVSTTDTVPTTNSATTGTTTPEIPMSEPYNRAKRAIENAKTLDAIDLLQSQVEKSVKLVQSEKDELLKLLVLKTIELKNVQTNSTQGEAIIQPDDSVANEQGTV